MTHSRDERDRILLAISSIQMERDEALAERDEVISYLVREMRFPLEVMCIAPMPARMFKLLVDEAYLLEVEHGFDGDWEDIREMFLVDGVSVKEDDLAPTRT